MRQYLTIFHLLVLSAACAFSQAQSRGIKPANDPQSFSGSTKLVVVGVSKYQNVPSLSYAHTDARAFYNYMVSKEGANIEEANTKLLLNEKATSANIFAMLDWLITETKEGETVIFYFAGHGDLENKTLMQNGFLLATDAPQAAYMAGGTVGVRYLQDYLTTLAQKNKARVILITDACHSGKLAGGLEGVANTATALQGNWESTIKILSSQPGELSQEGVKWNGGGGVFTYYLVKGMMGFADRNRDNKITVNELNIYLNDHVPSETNFSQNPSVLGNPSTVLAKIDSVAFAKIAGDEMNIKLNNNAVAMRGNDEFLKAKMDTASYNTYAKFKYCITHNYLIGDRPGYGNAVDLYNKLKESKKADIIILSAKRSLIAALQNPIQIALNCMLSGHVIPDTISLPETFQELTIAYQLADSTDISFKNIKTRYLFLKAIVTVMTEQKVDNGLTILSEAIASDSDFAPAYYGRGNFLRHLKKWEEVIADYKKALELCPRWTWAYNSLGDTYMELEQYEKAVALYEDCIKLNPDYGPAYSHLGFYYRKVKNDLIKSMYYIAKWDSVETLNKSAEGIKEVGNVYRDFLNDTAKAIEQYNKAAGIDPDFPETYLELSRSYSSKSLTAKNYRKKYVELKLIEQNKVLKRQPDNLDVIYTIAETYAIAGDNKKTLFWFEKLLQKEFDLEQVVKQVSYFDAVSKTKEYEELIKKYSKK